MTNSQKPLPITPEQAEFIDWKFGPGAAQRAIDAGLFWLNPNVHGLFAQGSNKSTVTKEAISG